MDSLGCWVVSALMFLPLLVGCSAAPKGEVRPPVLAALAEVNGPARTGGAQSTVLEVIGGVALVQLRADGFEKLPLNEKLLAYHLYRAALAGRDIAFDQQHRHALAIRTLLDEILAHPLGLTPEVESALLRYAKSFWLNNGPYEERNKTKLAVTFSRPELLSAVGIARANGADFSRLGRPVEELLAELDAFFFDPDFERLATNKNPGPGKDLLQESAVNYYQGITLADLQGFKERYPLNSRLARECDAKGKKCKLVEQVYRAGEQDAKGRKWLVEPGLYARQLAEVVRNLENAAALAAEDQAAYLRHLARHLVTGDPALFDSAGIAWLKLERPVDAILGFVETYKDPRGLKGEFEGLVYFKDEPMTAVMNELARLALYFEERAPWDERYKNLSVRVPVASAINALAGFGGAGPFTPLGINLPNAQWIREKHGSRSVMLANVMEAVRGAVAEAALEEFALPEELPALRRFRPCAARTMVALHEVIGHGSGKASERLDQDPAVYLQESYSTLEEARAELIALHHVFDLKLVEIGALESPEAALVAYSQYIRSDLLQLRRVKSGNRFEDDHMRAIHLIVQYLIRNGGGVEVRKVEGKTHYVLVDAEAARQLVARLLAEVMRIKAEGDADAARSLLADYAIEFDPALRDEVVRRAEQAGVPDFVAFHFPAPVLVHDEAGNLADVVLDYSKDFLTTMLEWDLMSAP